MQNLGQIWIFYKAGQTQLIQTKYDLGDPFSTLLCVCVRVRVCACVRAHFCIHIIMCACVYYMDRYS